MKSLWKKFEKLSLNQQSILALSAASILIAIGSLVTAIFAVIAAYDTRDLKTAVRELKNLAVESKGQTTALEAQVVVNQKGLVEQQAQTALFASRAEVARMSLENVAKGLNISQKQLAILARNERLMAEQSERDRINVVQSYRSIAMFIEELKFPKTIGDRVTAQMRIKNVGPSTLTIEDRYSSLSISDESIEIVSKRSFEMFKNAEKKLQMVNVGPGLGYTHTISLSEPVSDQMLFAVNHLGWNVIATAELIYRDPLGNLHHEYVCSYSNSRVRDQLCPTPLGD